MIENEEKMSDALISAIKSFIETPTTDGFSKLFPQLLKELSLLKKSGNHLSIAEHQYYLAEMLRLFPKEAASAYPKKNSLALSITNYINVLTNISNFNKANHNSPSEKLALFETAFIKVSELYRTNPKTFKDISLDALNKFLAVYNNISASMQSSTKPSTTCPDIRKYLPSFSMQNAAAAAIGSVATYFSGSYSVGLFWTGAAKMAARNLENRWSSPAIQKKPK